MRSRLTLGDSLLGGIIAMALVAGAGFVLWTLDRHAEEHGHDRPFANVGAVRAERPEARADGEGQDGGHAVFFATASLSDAVRRGRNGSDTP